MARYAETLGARLTTLVFMRLASIYAVPEKLRVPRSIISVFVRGCTTVIASGKQGPTYRRIKRISLWRLLKLCARFVEIIEAIEIYSYLELTSFKH